MPRNKMLNQQLRDERREQILSVALKLFASKGLAATKITDISSSAGISQGLIYHYYRSKEQIFVEMIRIAFERLNFACSELENMPVSPREKISTAITGLLHIMSTNEEYEQFTMLIAMANASEAIPEEAKAILNKEYRKPYDVMTRIILAGQKEGTLKPFDAAQLALVFWTTFSGMAIYKAVHGEAFVTPEADILKSIFF